MTFDTVTVFQVVWWKWSKKKVFWACIFWFHEPVEAIELYPDSIKVETTLSSSAFFLGQFFCQSTLVPPGLPRSLSQAGRCFQYNAGKMTYRWSPIWCQFGSDSWRKFWKPTQLWRTPTSFLHCIQSWLLMGTQVGSRCFTWMDHPLLITTNQASGAGENKMRQNHHPREEMDWWPKHRGGLKSHNINGHISGRFCFRDFRFCQKLGGRLWGSSDLIPVDAISRDVQSITFHLASIHNCQKQAQSANCSMFTELPICARHLLNTYHVLGTILGLGTEW